VEIYPILPLDASPVDADKLVVAGTTDVVRSVSAGRPRMAVLCPECDSPIAVDEELDQGETLECEECGAELEVVSTDPLELVAIEDEGYDDEDLSQISGDEDE
jgi:alpha-aminoadipate carrier protein LysW